MVTPEISELIAGLSPEKRALLATHLKNKGASPNTFPLSYAQERIWFIQHLDPGSSLYNTPFAVRLKGPLDVSALEQALNEVARRHEILRSVFPLVNGEPVQVIRPPQAQTLPLRDLRALPESEREEAVLRITVEEGQKPFDLPRELPSRTHLLRLKDDEHVVVRIEHHIISDASSQEIFVREVATLYAAYASGNRSPLPELPLQYADFAVWQRKRLQGEALEQQLDYWKSQLGGNLPVLNLPTSKPRQAVQSFRGAIEMDLFPARLAHELAELSRREGVTLFITLLAAFQTLLHRYTNESDIAVGTPILNRNRVEFESLMGFFGNTLVMRTDLSGDPSFRELLKREREVALGAYANQDVPFEKVVRVAQPERSLSYTPLLQVMFTLQNASAPVQNVAGLTWSPINIDIGSARFDLTLSIEQTPTEMGIMLQYASDLFSVETSRRMLAHLRNLLEGIVRDPGRRLSEFTLLSETEQRQVLLEWNDTQRDYRQNKTLHALLAEQAARTPDAPALSLEKRQLNYGELNARANQLGRHLQSLGVKPEVRVGILMERSLEMVISLLAVLKAGGGYVPLDPAYPQERLAFMLTDSDVPVLLTQQHLLDALPAHRAAVVPVDAAWPQIAQQATDDFESGATPDNLAYVIYTSGSTGQPKGSMIAHRGIVNRLLWMQEAYQLTAAETVLQKTPFSFDVSVWEFFWPLLVGARLALAVPGGHQDSAYLVRTIREEKVTTLHFVPSMLQVLLEAEEVEQCVSLRRVICSGEALSTELQQRLFARTKAELHNLYGPTEASVDVTFWECQRDDARTSVPIGRPIANTQIYLLDGHLQPVPVGVAGELYIGGDGLARGYLSRPDLTAEKFIPHPFAAQPGARLYRTGDQARHLPGGEIEFLGRLDHQVKLRGFRIELGEIETALAAHPSIREMAVALREDAPGDKRLVAYLVAAQGTAHLNTNQLREFLQDKLPDYMIPAAFVFIESLPLTPSGKLDRRALPALEGARPELQSQFVAPRTETEQVLAAIWSDVLRVERIGVHDGFFELGGDSILSIQVISRANEKGLRLLPKQIFQHQTIAQLAIAAETAPHVEAEQETVVGTFALTPVQRWFFEQDFADPHHFNQSLMLEIAPAIDTSLLPEIVESILNRHDALRLRFDRQWSNWQQVSGTADLAEVFLRVDLSHLPSEEQGRAIEAKAAELQQSLDLTRGPLIRVALFETGEGRCGRLLLIIHHLVVDGVSWRILLEDLEKAYRQSSAGEQINLGAKTTSFKQWSQRLTQHAQTKSVEREAGYWHAGAERPFKPLPHSGDGGVVETALHERHLTSSLSIEETQTLLHEVGAAYHTQINDVLLAALVQTLAHWTGERRFLVDLEGHGREDILEGLDVSRTVGWFTTIFPVLLEQDINRRPGETLRQVKEQLRGIPQRGIGYGLLRYLNEDESLREQAREFPQAEIIFNYLGQLDGTLSETGGFALARESAGLMRSPRARRPYPLDISASIVGGRLQVVWSYGEERLQRQVVESLAAWFNEALREIMSHCLTIEPGWTPSDFPLSKLNQEKLDRILSAQKDVEDIYALSPMQEGMLFQSLYEAGTGVYVTQVTCELRGELDIPAFEQSWQQVVNRHPSLRTSFAWETLDEPVQLVKRHVEISLEQVDWRGLEPDAQQSLLESYLKSVREQGLNLNEAPLMKFALFRTGEEVYRFVWNCHHLLVDGWSLPIIIREVFTTYDARRRGEQPSLVESRPYKDFIVWLSRQDANSAENYWRAMLEEWKSPTAIQVGKAAQNSDTPGPDYGEQEIRLTTDETERLHAAAKRLQVTVNTLVQGAWGTLLSRYSNEDDVVFGVTSSGRPPSLWGVEKIVGIFINTLPMRVRVPSEASVGTWLQELQAQQAEQRQFEYSTLAQVHGWSEIPRSMRLFDSILVYENYPPYSFERERGRQLEIGDVHALGRTNYPLTVLAKGTTELLLKLWYDTSRFDDSAIAQMLGHLRRIIQSLASNPDQRLADVNILSESELQGLLVEWNAPRTTYPANLCIHELFEQQAAQRPDAVALVADEGSLTYAELNGRANRLAHYLRASGVGPEARVGLMLERSSEMVVALLAILKAGGAYVPLDPSYPDERLSFLRRDAGLHTLLTVQKFADKAASERTNVVLLDADADRIARQPEDNPPHLTHPDNLAYVIYTSGSTGQPKGALVTHENITRLFAATEHWFNFDADDVWTLFHSYAFDFSVWELWGALAYGGRLVVVPHAVSRAPEEFYQLLIRERVTVLNQTPSAFRQLMAVEESAAAAGQKLSLRLVIFGGEALELSSLKPWFERHGDEQPRLVNMYGITETTVHVTYCPLTFADARSGVGSRIGVALPDLQVYVLDRELRPVPVGVPGELYVGGDGLARGYLNQAALTAERFIPHPYGTHPGARLYRSGDLARRMPSGEFEYLGRNDQQVKLRGFRIEPGEIEAALREQQGIADCVVLVRESAGGEKRLVAYCARRSGEGDAEVSAGQVRAQLKERLPDYMVPSQVALLERLPLTPNGKVDRNALSALETVEHEHEAKFSAPRTPAEEVLANIWASVLHIERVGRDDGFFELGGHSLLATQIMSRVRETFNVEVPLSALFENPTPAGLAIQIEEAMRTGAGISTAPLKPVAREQSLPLSFAQQRLWFLDQLEPGSFFYNIPAVLRLKGRLDIAVLQRTLTEITRRHEVLRTTFAPAADGAPTQIIHAPAAFDLPLTDLSALPPDRREAEAVRLATQEAQRPFDLAHGPLLRLGLLRLDDEQHIALVTLHHIISDGWSTGILIREVAALYEAYSAGAESPLPELAVQYADYAVWQREWLSGEVLAEQLGYWREQLGGELGVVELPTDRPRPPVQSYRGMNETLMLSPELSKSLKELCRRESVTLYMALLGAFVALLQRYTGQTDIVVGTPIAGRNRGEVEGLIGFFVNTLVLRTELSGEPSYREVLRRVREVALGAYAHQDLPFEKLVEELQPDRDLSRHPLFQVMLEIQNEADSLMQLPDLSMESVGIDDATAKFDLTLLVGESENGLSVRFEYSIDLFEAETIKRMGRHFETLLTGIVADPARTVADVSLLSAAERGQLLEQWNETTTPFPLEQCFHELFEAQSERSPESVAAACGDARLTYRELNGRANQLAHYLRAQGAKPEERICVYLDRGLDLLVSILAIFKAGGVYVPLDPAYPKERLAFILEDAQASLLLTRQQFLDNLPALDLRLIRLDADWQPAIAAQSDAAPSNVVQPDNLAYVIYTSGSTGLPKGAMIEHRGMVNHLFAKIQDLQLTGADIVGQTASQAFDISVWQFLVPLLVGGRVEIFEDEIAHHPARLFAAAAREQLTILEIVPALLGGILEADAGDDFDLHEASSGLRWLIVTGEALPPHLCRRWMEIQPDVPLMNAYGPTECSDDVTHYAISEPLPPEVVLTPIGRPIANMRLYVADKMLRLLPIGVAGELCAGGTGVGRGYLNQPGLTAMKFVPDPFATQPGARLYRTGDLARYLPDGNIEFLGRLDHQVKVRGFRIELGEIEAALRRHEAVREVVVLVREQQTGDARLSAYVVTDPASSPAPDEFRSHLKKALPEYMIPSAFVMLDALPLTPNGKIDRNALARLDDETTPAERVYVAPRTAVEEVVTAIWIELLKLEQISIHDNFFNLGGHSLLSIQVLTRLQKTFQVELPLRVLFEAATIAELSEQIVAMEAKPGQAEKIARIVKKLGSLSAEDKQRMLQQKRQREVDES